MKRGHVTGTKRERTGSSDWYKTIEEEQMRRIEEEWQLTQAIEEYYEECDGDLVPWDRAA